MIDSAVQLSFFVFFALLFAGSGAHKLADVASFRVTIISYDLIPYRLAPLVVILLAAFEIICALCLLLPQFRELALMGVAGLMSLYTLVLAIALMRGQGGIDCGCGWGKQLRARLLVLACLCVTACLS